MVIKVKGPIASEYEYFRKGLLLFCYLYLASEPTLTDALLSKGVTSIAYETIQTASGALPLLAPMSEVAGRMSTQIGARLLERSNGGKGVLLAGVPGVDAARVAVIPEGPYVIPICRMDSSTIYFKWITSFPCCSDYGLGN